ncbi:MAG: DNA adenine methylase [Dehalococcoidia bacterium]|nr:DNA adenine methylase [Dehalococcoidia bacterium]
MASPFLKWAGGKARLAPIIAARAPRAFRRYHEPFLGGGGVFFALEAAGRLESAVLNDANAGLIECFTVVRDDVEALAGELRPLAELYASSGERARQQLYYECRAAVPESPVGRAARLIFLNRTCYNGLYRVNRRGHFNVPHGRYRNPRILDEPGLRAASEALKGVELTCMDFEEACAAAGAGDFVYLDPPYQPLSATASFTSYTAGDFGPGDQRRLRDAFESMVSRGAGVLLSNSEHEAIRELYEGRGHRLETVSMSRAINSVGTKRAPVAELLIYNPGKVEGCPQPGRP